VFGGGEEGELPVEPRVDMNDTPAGVVGVADGIVKFPGEGRADLPEEGLRRKMVLPIMTVLVRLSFSTEDRESRREVEITGRY